jgi:hypothetical protein
MHERATQLRLVIDTDPEADNEELEQLTRRLRQEILDSDVGDVYLVKAGEVPTGAKSGDPVTWGALLVTLAASEGVIATLINLLKSWLTRNEQRRIALEIDGDRLEVTGLSSEEQHRLINEWMNRHRLILMPND